MSVKRTYRWYERGPSKPKRYFNPTISKLERESFLLIARQLGYPKEVQEALEYAKSDLDCEHILHDARNMCK